MILIILSLLLIILLIIVIRNSKFENFDKKTFVPEKLNYTCVNPEKILIDGNELNYSPENFVKAAKFCLEKEKCKGLMIKDNIFYFSNSILKIPDNSPDTLKAWILNPEILYGDIIIEKENIGITKNVDPNYYIDGGSLVLTSDGAEDDPIFCIKDKCLSKSDIYNINKAPVIFQPQDTICLYDDNKNPVCVNEFELGMLAGTSKFNLKNVSLTNPNEDNYVSPYSFKVPNGEISISSPISETDTTNETYNIHSKGSTIGAYNLNLQSDKNKATNFFIVPPQLSNREQKCTSNNDCKNPLLPDCVIAKGNDIGLCSAPTQKCIGDYGKKVGDPLCCGQTGTINTNEYICKDPLFPKCKGFKQDVSWGQCVQKECIADYGAKIGDKLCCNQPGTINKGNSSYICNKENPNCVGFEQNVSFGKCSKQTVLPLLSYKYK